MKLEVLSKIKILSLNRSKTLKRKRAVCIALWSGIGSSLMLFTRTECQSTFSVILGPKIDKNWVFLVIFGKKFFGRPQNLEKSR